MYIRNFLINCTAVCFATVAMTIPALAGNITLPKNWGKPTASDLSDEWRNKDTGRFSIANGDFNGDGKIDQAMLLVSHQSHKLGLFVFISQENDLYRSHKLDVIDDPLMIHAMGIEKVSHGRYKTACGKGYWDCKKGEPSEIVIEHDAINYFKTESANSYFYWDAKTKKFKRIWMSD